MKKVVFNVQEPYKTYLLNGKKTVEGRLNKGKFANLELGDYLIFDSGELLEVIGKRKYKSFIEMIKSEGKEKVIPNAETDEEAEKIYFEFYNKKQEKEFGVIAIEIKLIEN